MTNKHDSNHSSTSSAGGVFIAAGGIVGALFGVVIEQPSIGMLAGLAIGGLIALAIWLHDRK